MPDNDIDINNNESLDKELNEEEDLSPGLKSYKKSIDGKKVVEEYTIIEENPDKEKDLVDIDKIKAVDDDNKSITQEELDDPNSEININFYNDLALDSEIFDDYEFIDEPVEEAPVNELELDNGPQLGR